MNRESKEFVEAAEAVKKILHDGAGEENVVGFERDGEDVERSEGDS